MSGTTSPNPIITLTTDFGLKDGYVGVMKGVMLSINPALTLIDLTHQIPPQDIWAARFQLSNSLRYFPAGTVHLAVVDPGVGGDRQAIALQIQPSDSTAPNSPAAPSWLVGPNNGIFSGVLQQFEVQQAVLLENPDYWRVPSPSKTFHGRDVFAPVAAHLASGVELEMLGQALPPDQVEDWGIPDCEVSPDATVPTIAGIIQHIDGFGNLITNIPNARVNPDWIQRLGWSVEIGAEQIAGAETYSDALSGELVAFRGSHGWIEVAVNGGNAQAELGASIADELKITTFRFPPHARD